MAAEELELAREWDTPRAIAVARRAVALAGDREEEIAGLAEAVRLLDDTPFRLDRARARCDLGAALRRAGRRRDAREALSQAMDEAHACGAEPLAERAADELRRTGARPRRRAISGVDALTPSERRVAEVAAAGRSNREIAEELFVTMATVETHLSRIYRKLDLAGRDGLAEALRG
jgi:DNA-binding NarL/FixJ family response regulator